MKTRNGFVSNSSSSSFVICLPNIPSTSEELHALMFPDGPTEVSPYGTGYSSEKIAEEVFSDLQHETPLTTDQIIDEFSSGSFAGLPSWPNTRGMTDKERNAAWQKHSKDTQRAAALLSARFITENPNSVFFSLTYSDNDGSLGSVMEHGGIFDNINAKQMSHH